MNLPLTPLLVTRRVAARALSAVIGFAAVTASAADPPTRVTASATSSTSARITWRNPSGNIQAIQVYQRRDEGAWSFGENVPPGSTSAVRDGLSAGADYCFKVRVQIGGQWSDFSSPACLPPVPAPTSVTATAVDFTSVRVAWRNPSGGVDAIQIYDSRNGGGYTHGENVPPTLESALRTGLTSGADYCFKVRVQQFGRWSEFSEPGCVRPPLPPLAPEAPVIIGITPGASVPLGLGQIGIQFVAGITWSARLDRLNDQVRLVDLPALTTPSIPLPALSAGASYRLHVQASGPGGLSPVTTLDFSGLGLAAPAGARFSDPESLDYGDFTADPVAGATTYEIRISGATAGELVFQSDVPRASFPIDEEPGSVLSGTIVAFAAFSVSPASAASAIVKRPRPNPNRVTSWARTIEVSQGGTLSTRVTKQALEIVQVQKYSFVARRFVPDDTFDVEPVVGTEREVILNRLDATPAHSGLYEIRWIKPNGQLIQSCRFYCRVTAAEQPEAVKLEALPNADKFSGFQLVGLTKADAGTFNWIRNRFASGDFADFPLEIECLPVTFHHPLKPAAEGFINPIHPMEAVYRLVNLLYPPGRPGRPGKLRIEVDFFFAHRTGAKADTEYRFNPGVDRSTFQISGGINFEEFTSGQGAHFAETMRRTDMLADVLQALDARPDATTLEGKLDFVVCIDLEDMLGSRSYANGKGTVNDMTNAYHAVASRLSQRGIGTGFRFPVRFRRVYVSGNGTDTTRIDPISHEHHDAPLDENQHFKPEFIPGLLGDLRSGDGYSNDGDGDVPGLFSDSQIRQLYGIGSETGLIRVGIPKGVSLKLWRSAMNLIGDDAGKSPRHRSRIRPFQSTEGTLALAFINQCDHQRSRQRSVGAPDEGVSRQAEFQVASDAVPERSGPLILPGTLEPLDPWLTPSLANGWLTLTPSHLPIGGAILESSLNFHQWDPVTWLRPDTSAVTLLRPAAFHGFLRLGRESLPPAMPTGVRARLEAGSVTVSWSPNGASLARFHRLQRRLSDGPWVELERIYEPQVAEDGSLSALDSTPPAAHWAEYRVIAGNSADDSIPSGGALVWIPHRPGPLLQPAITTGGINGSSPVLTWTPDPLGLATAIVIERAPEGGEFAAIAVTGPDASFVDEDALDPGIYAYRLFGRNESGAGPVSPVFTASVTAVAE